MSRSALADLRIVCVDDHENMLKLLRTLLSAGGMRDVTVFTEARTALAHLAAGRSDLVVCDLQMKPMDGLEFTRRLRASDSPAVARLPVLLLTGHADPERVNAAKDAGVDDFLVKPISVGDLKTRIARVCDRRRSVAV
jgi:CheY-like chemotaxis protein